MNLEDIGNRIVIEYNHGSVSVLKEDIVDVSTNDTRERIVLIVDGGRDRIIRFAAVESPVFASFSDLSDWINGATQSSGGAIEIIADADDASSDSIDVSAYSVSEIRTLFLNNAFVPSDDYTLSSGTVSFDINIDEGDIISIYE